jgi:hypothetical protein
MKKRVYLATIKSDITRGRVILAADFEKNDVGDYSRWNIVALLPRGTELETYVDTLPNGNLDDAVKLVAEAWRDERFDLQWLIDEGSIE